MTGSCLEYLISGYYRSLEMIQVRNKTGPNTISFQQSISLFPEMWKMRGLTKKRLRVLTKWPQGQHVSQHLKRARRKAVRRLCSSQRNKRKNTHTHKRKNSRYTTDQVQIKTPQTSRDTSNELTRNKDGLLASNETSAYITPEINEIYIW